MYNDHANDVVVYSRDLNIELARGREVEVPDGGNSLDRDSDGRKLLRLRADDGEHCFVVSFSHIENGSLDEAGRYITEKLIYSGDGTLRVIPRSENYADVLASGELEQLPKLLQCASQQQE